MLPLVDSVSANILEVQNNSQSEIEIKTTIDRDKSKSWCYGKKIIVLSMVYSLILKNNEMAISCKHKNNT